MVFILLVKQGFFSEIIEADQLIFENVNRLKDRILHCVASFEIDLCFSGKKLEC